MPEFIVTGPDGKEYSVTGDNAEGAVAAVRKMVEGAAQAPARIPTRAEGSNLSVAPGTTPEQAADIPEGMVYDPETGGYFDAALQAKRGGESAGFATKFLQGIPFLGQWVDEAAGKADQALTGASPELAQETVRQSQKQFETTNPKTAAAAEFGGGVTAALPAALAAGPVIAAAAPSALGAQATVGLGTGLGFGALEGAVSGAGAANDGNRMQGAGMGALVGGATGGIVGAAAPVIAAGARSGIRAVKGTAERAMGKAVGVSPEAARALKSGLDGEDLGAAAARLARGGQDAMLVEAGPSMQALGDAVGNTGGTATRIMRDAIDNRSAGAASRMTSTLDAALGKPSGRADLAAVLRRNSQAARSSAYKAAYETPIDYSSPAGRRIEDILTRMPERTGKAALAKANERMLYEGRPNLQIMAQVADDGRVRYSEMPNAEQLDHIKRAFDDIVRDGTDAVTGKLSSDAHFAQRIARDLRNAHGAANPGYRKALRVGMDSIQGEQAIESGYKAMLPSTTREAFRNQMRGMNATQRDAAKFGVRQYVDDLTANVQAIMSRPGGGTEIGEAIKGLKTLSSRASREKLAVLLGKDAGPLLAQVDELSTAFEIQAAMHQNSKTAIRQAVQGSVEDTVAPGTFDRLLAGEPLGATKHLAQIFTGKTPQAQAARQAGIYEEIATALTSIKGAQAQRALTQMQAALRSGKMTEAQAERLARQITTAIAAASHQSGTQGLEALTR